MNAVRRKRIEAVKLQLEDIKSDEELAFESLPDSLQGSEKGDSMQNNISNIDSAISSLDEIE